MLKKLVAASIVAAFASMTPALAQDAAPAPAAPAAAGTMAPHATMAKKPAKKMMMKKRTTKKKAAHHSKMKMKSAPKKGAM